MSKKYFREEFQCLLCIASPVHIGCDEVYEPTSFVLSEKTGEMIVFDPLEFLRDFRPEEKKRLSEICKRGTAASIIELFKFIQSKPANGRRVAVCSEFPKHFQQTVSMDTRDERKVHQELNRFQIARTAYRQEDDRPYIPGSSVKGAVRTAYLNSRAKQQPATFHGGWQRADELERLLMDYHGIADDPFRLVKVSDFYPVGEVRTRIVYAVNEKKKPTGREARGPSQVLEVIEPGCTFKGSIIVEKPLVGANIRHPATMDDLISCCKDFYSGEHSREQEELCRIGVAKGDADIGGSFGSILIRIGRHCGAESLTIEGHRSIKIMGRRGERPQRFPNATTFWLVSDTRKPMEKKKLQPFGWSFLKKVNAESDREADILEKIYLQKRSHEMVPESSVGSEETIAKPSGPHTSELKPTTETWVNVHLSFTPNNGEITANQEGRKATTKEKDLVPESLRNRLFGKKKNAVAQKVDLEIIGNSVKIVKII